MLRVVAQQSAGVSLIAVVLAIAAGSIIIVAMTVLVTRQFGISREQTEQVRITEDARIVLERTSDAIRDARSADINHDDTVNLPSEVWLQHGGDYDIQFYTNLDTEPGLERVHYFLVGTELKRGVRDPHDAPLEEETVVTMAKSLRNMSLGTPLFTYYPEDSAVPAAAPVVVEQDIERVGITLVIDVNDREDPPAATASTIVTPRASDTILIMP